MKRRIVGLLISLAAAGVVLYQADFSELARLAARAEAVYLAPLVGVVIASLALSALRWRLMMAPALSYADAAKATLIGIGANMALVARGGELLKLYYTRTLAHASGAVILRSLFLERLMDLILTGLIGATALLLVGGSRLQLHASYAIGVIAALVFALCSAVLAIKYGNAAMEALLARAFVLLRLKRFYVRRVRKHVFELGRIDFRRLAAPFAVSVALWGIFYPALYLAIEALLGISFTYEERLFLVFCGAVGVAIPGAPSSAGTLHASIVSGFVLLGRSADAGLLFGAALHLAQFVIYSSAGLLAYGALVLGREPAANATSAPRESSAAVQRRKG